MSYNVRYFTDKLISQFNGLQALLEFNTVQESGEILGHCLFADALNGPLEELLINDSDVDRIKKYVAFIEDMYANGDDAVKNIVEVSLIEYYALGYTNCLNNLYKYLSPELCDMAKRIKLQSGSPEK